MDDTTTTARRTTTHPAGNARPPRAADGRALLAAEANARYAAEGIPLRMSPGGLIMSATNEELCQDELQAAEDEAQQDLDAAVTADAVLGCWTVPTVGSPRRPWWRGICWPPRRPARSPTWRW